MIELQSVRRPILDHGYIEFIESWGSDERIIESARMSTAKGFQGWGGSWHECLKDSQHTQDPMAVGTRVAVCHQCGGPRHYRPGDEKLLAYLYNNKHMTPFEMAGLVIEVKAPIMVFREWHRHRTQSYNEMSARYIPLPDQNYLPDLENVLNRARDASTNKQARTASEHAASEKDVFDWLRALSDVYNHAQRVYNHGLAIGIPKELARLPVPVGRYSVMRASANLRNWLAFLTLRMDVHAQWEIRQYANAVGDLISQSFPRTWELFKGSK